MKRLALFLLTLPLALDLAYAQTNTGWQYDAGAVAGYGSAKYRTRKGTPEVKGSEIFSRDLNTQEDEFRPGLWLRATKGRDAFSISGWTISSDGDGSFTEDKYFDGDLITAGTPISSEYTYLHLKADWLRSFELPADLTLQAGLAVEYMSFESDNSFGDSDLDGIYPTPQLRLTWAFTEGWELEGAYNGFHVPFNNGDTEITDPYEMLVAIRHTWDRYTIEAGYDLYHLHIEKDANEIQEEIVHMRHRAYYVSAGITF